MYFPDFFKFLCFFVFYLSSFFNSGANLLKNHHIVCYLFLLSTTVIESWFIFCLFYS